MHGDIDNVIKFLAENLVFDEKGYPELIGATPQQKLLFGVRHSALHFAKTAGKIAAVSEDTDHGDALNLAEIKKQVSKAFANTLRLAELAGMSEKEILEAIEAKYRKKIFE